MTRPFDDAEFERLFELFDWAERQTVFRVRFVDGDAYELTGVAAAQDDGEPPHASASVVRTVSRAAGGVWPAENAMFFRLPDIAEVADRDTGEILYRAV